MAITVEDATTYINANCINVDDWTDADDAKKLRIVNVAGRTLTAKYAQYTIPDAAVYEYANALAIAFNDTNALQQQGVASFGISGVANFTFKDGMKTGLDALIPDVVYTLIGAENGVKLSKRAVKWVTM
ncbi:hypothetical protein PAECIP111892_01767 [Paenibacillus auburnensis]|uniref:Uncharacterized protein n=1 Tax=Paenibacillus auburnensis TaxID=2905649 RepID=A0ABM9BTM2_9BACL|nr:hypothetical protein [Paenibacillus auburnensis]CAH1194617.1 hypothetical protein PAECIP111892_01767 [Paenibacillus auburnensis]